MPVLKGSTVGQIFKLPDATTITEGYRYQIKIKIKTMEHCDWCGAEGKPIGSDYMGAIFQCTQCDHEWQTILEVTNG